ncbi:hypothetical protein GKZ68_05985 [Hymenobacter sp. BRD128]|uniref:hypothetical protein n=1 Tax=Hymenobacter sp. BRD128 TaxID=2675878 RepID=UPI0015666B23|nr:hypothetical protein [Hymenobacter sp. BRD128]QKG56233.1 hypothetical protein GKZ68_05985 [Hymenobacter sp. BRD128]
MSSEIKNLEVNAVKTAKAVPKAPADKSEKDNPQKPDHKHDKLKAQLRKLTTHAGTVGEYGANPDGIYDRFTLTAAGARHTIKFPPHFGQALHQAAQPGAAVTVLAYPHTTPKGDEHLHLASLEVSGQHLRPQSAGPAAEPFTAQGKVAELLRDPQGHPRALRLEGEASELRFPPHLGEQLAAYLAIGAVVQASGSRRADRPGEVRAPGNAAPLHLELLTVGGESFLIR